MAERVPSWALDGFLERFDEWAAQETPTQDQRTATMAWIMSRYDDPYEDAAREAVFDDYFFARVPDTEDDKGQAVGCSFWIIEITRTVRCDRIATLSLPF